MLVALALLLVSLAPHWAVAQEYPTKPITVIIPFGPGGHSDLVMRPLTAVAQKYLGQPLILQMKPGGQGIIGTELFAKSAPDGYTLLAAGAGWNSALPALEGRSKGPDDLEPVARLSEESTFMTVRTDSPHKSLKDLIAYVKANPGKVTIGIGGPYTTSETFWRWMMKTHGVKVRLVKFGGGSQMMLAGLGGHVDVFGGSPLSVSEQVRAGKVRPLVYYGEHRHREYPNVPTAREEGLDLVLEIWNGVVAPKGTPRAVIDKLDQAFRKMLEDPTVKEAMTKNGEEIEYLGPDDFGKFWRKDYQFFVSMKDAYSIKGVLEESQTEVKQ
jgi:tripartite-type tricarboxylate transporter receptor subunit TctC